MSAGVDVPAGLAADDVDGWLNLLLAHGSNGSSQSVPLSFSMIIRRAGGPRANSPRPGRSRNASSSISEGSRSVTGYQELTDPHELRRRIVVQSALRERDKNRPLPVPSQLLEAMEAGLPECSGVALGFDRLLMCRRAPVRFPK